MPRFESDGCGYFVLAAGDAHKAIGYIRKAEVTEREGRDRQWMAWLPGASVIEHPDFRCSTRARAAEMLDLRTGAGDDCSGCR